MATRFVQINMKAHDEVALGDFWAKVLGWGISSEAPGVTNLEPEDLTYPDPRALYIDLVVSSEPKTAKNRVHVDLATTSAARSTARNEDSEPSVPTTTVRYQSMSPPRVGRGD